MMNNVSKKRITESDRNCSDLHEDLLVLIARKLQCVAHVLSFRDVCVSWRSATKTGSTLNGTNQFPWLLQVQESDGKTKYLFDFTYAKLYKTTKYSHNIKTWCLGWKGWVFVVTERGIMSLLHAFKRTKQIYLQSRKSLQGKLYDRINVLKVVLSSDPLTNPSEYTLAIIYNASICYNSRSAYWRPGDKTYTKIQAGINCKDVIFHGGLLYLVASNTVMAYDVIGHTPTISRVYVLNTKIPHYTIKWEYLAQHLVELGEELILLIHSSEEIENRYISRFSAFLVSELSEWKETKDLGNRAIFIGSNQSFVLDNASEIQGCMPNHIYKTKMEHVDSICRHFHHVGAYNMTSTTTEYFKCTLGEKNLHCSHSQLCNEQCRCCHLHPPLWIQPTFD